MSDEPKTVVEKSVVIEGDSGWVSSGGIRVGRAAGYVTFENCDGDQLLFLESEMSSVAACLRQLGVI